MAKSREADPSLQLWPWGSLSLPFLTIPTSITFGAFALLFLPARTFTLEAPADLQATFHSRPSLNPRTQWGSGTTPASQTTRTKNTDVPFSCAAKRYWYYTAFSTVARFAFNHHLWNERLGVTTISALRQT